MDNTLLLWMIDYEWNILLGIEQLTGKVKTVKTVPTELNNRVRSFGIQDGGEIYFPSYDGKKYLIYNVQQDNINIISTDIECKGVDAYRKPIICGKRIVFVPFKKNDNIYLVNSLTKHVEVDTDYKNKGLEALSAAALDDSRILLATKEGMYIYNLNNADISTVKIDNFTGGIRDICIDRDNIYAVSQTGGKIFVISNNNLSVLKTLQLENKGELDYQAIVDCGDKLFLMQREASFSLIIDKSNFEIKKVSINDGYKFRTVEYIGDNKVWFREWEHWGKKLKLYDISKLEEIETKYSTAEVLKRLPVAMCVPEGPRMSLNEFINYI